MERLCIALWIPDNISWILIGEGRSPNAMCIVHGMYFLHSAKLSLLPDIEMVHIFSAIDRKCTMIHSSEL